MPDTAVANVPPVNLKAPVFDIADDEVSLSASVVRVPVILIKSWLIVLPDVFVTVPVIFVVPLDAILLAKLPPERFNTPVFVRF